MIIIISIHCKSPFSLVDYRENTFVCLFINLENLIVNDITGPANNYGMTIWELRCQHASRDA